MENNEEIVNIVSSNIENLEYLYEFKNNLDKSLKHFHKNLDDLDNDINELFNLLNDVNSYMKN
jgi:peptidoglycan hydrolase CwlO-like protein